MTSRTDSPGKGNQTGAKTADGVVVAKKVADLTTTDLKTLFDGWIEPTRTAAADAQIAKADYMRQVSKLDERTTRMEKQVSEILGSVNALASAVESLSAKVDAIAATAGGATATSASASATGSTSGSTTERVIVNRRPPNRDGDDLDTDEGWQVMIGDVEDEVSGYGRDTIPHDAAHTPNRIPTPDINSTIDDHVAEREALEVCRTVLRDARVPADTFERLTNLVAVLDRVVDAAALDAYVAELRKYGVSAATATTLKGFVDRRIRQR